MVLPPFTDEQRAAFNLLKESVTKPPVLRLPRTDLPCSVDTDACEYQIGCALQQEYEDGSRYPIGFWSRSLSAAEKNYSVGGERVPGGCLVRPDFAPVPRTEAVSPPYGPSALKWLLNLSDASSRLASWRLRLL